MSIEQGLAPLVKTVVVPTTPERAFKLFTEELGKWWPLATHSVRGEQATDVRLEGAVGGQIVEYDAGGPVGSWGTVSDWDPPHTVSFSWHPGSDPKQAGHVTIRFTAIDDGAGGGSQGGGESGASGSGAGGGSDSGGSGASGSGGGESGASGSGAGGGSDSGGSGASGSGAGGSGVSAGSGSGGSSGGGSGSWAGSTLVELTHTGWERVPDGAQVRANYDTGWAFVLRRFEQFRP
ncbi:SRPBCC domain-containing protein [Kribbella lupini]|uniref:Activator of Hsp90 ATPase homologue 1/2-like C-terminal domain-containing protein n=1 Tax=Kribbella lupini TaxID=291602 RepID=A0ABP4MUI8_9ACTN